MNKFIDPRRAVVFVNYQGTDITAALAPDLKDFTYTDAESGSIDDISLTVADITGKWINTWSPAKGDIIKASIKVFNWDKYGDNRILNLGSFEVDSVQFKGNPDEVTIKALALSVGTGVKQEKNTKAWEKFTLRSIAQEIARKAKLKLVYESSVNPQYDRQDQTDVTDLNFLMDLCKQEGLALKVTNSSLVVFNEYTYEQAAPKFVIEKGVSNILSHAFEYSNQDVAYVACEISYQPAAKKDPVKKTDKKDTPKTLAVTEPSKSTTKKDKNKGKKKKTVVAQPKPITVIYRPPGAPKTGPILKLKESVGSQAEALRVAANKLREQNKNANRATIDLMGDIRCASGVTFDLKKFGRFSAKYIIVSASHSYGSSGYTTSLDIRKVLGW